MSEKCLSVVVPIYNEEKTLETIVGKILQIPQLLEIVLVDDCSRDSTPQVIAGLLERYPGIISTTRHAKNGGKTEALKTGFRMTKGDIVIVQDADLEYDPAEIPARAVYFYHYIANKLITFSSNLATNINLTDVETCYKAFRGDIIRKMIINSSGFGFEIEVTAKVAKLKCAIYETPISYYGRTYEEGKKITAWDGVDAIWYVIKYNLFTSLQASYTTIPDVFLAHAKKSH